ncbi:MAG: hypothetical protein LBQ76_04805 [Candidatus Fibromonas sp.]|jgi:hypothetical protein|nr:hypothetical protein [Candidatus Fibromonas sp.]
MARESRVITFAAVVLAAAFVFSCSSGDDGGTENSSSSYQSSSSFDDGYWFPSSSSVAWTGEIFIDPRDGKEYKTKDFGNGSVWFVESLNFNGKFEYTKEETRNACPSGWHLPNDYEFTALIASISVEDQKYFTNRIWWAFIVEYREIIGISYGDVPNIYQDRHGIRCAKDWVPPVDIEMFTDTRDNKKYKIKDIGNGSIWFMENLAFNGKTEYYWNEVMEACPNGWHLPSNEEWLALGNVWAENNMVFTNGYDRSIICDYNFYWWSVTEYDSEIGYQAKVYGGQLIISDDDYDYRSKYRKHLVRCVKD